MVFFSFYCLLPLPASASSDFLFVLPRAPAFNHFQFDTNTNTNTNKIQIQIFKYLSYLDPFKSSSPGLRRGKRSGKRRQPILKLRSENSFLWNRKNLLTWYCAFCWDWPQSQWSRHQHYCHDPKHLEQFLCLRIWAFLVSKPHCVLTKHFGFNKWYCSQINQISLKEPLNMFLFLYCWRQRSFCIAFH